MIITTSSAPQKSKQLVIQTRQARNIPNDPGRKLLPGQVQNYLKETQAEYPRAKLRRLPTAIYNCHGLTFLSRRATMDDGDVQMVLADDDYYQVSLNDVMIGDIVLYVAGDGGIEHTGIIVDLRRLIIDMKQSLDSPPTPVVLSKWGQKWECIHDYDYGPWANSKIMFMREGKND